MARNWMGSWALPLGEEVQVLACLQAGVPPVTISPGLRRDGWRLEGLLVGSKKTQELIEEKLISEKQALNVL